MTRRTGASQSCAPVASRSDGAPASSVRVPLTFVAVLVALALTGYLSSRVNDTPRLRPTVRLVAGGAVALVATFAIGSAVGALIG